MLAFFILTSFFSVQVLASSENDILFHGSELDNYITLLTSLLAITLFIFTFIAYKRTGRTKLIYVAIAFLLFAVKGAIQTSDMFMNFSINWIDPIATILDFAILLLFFFGIIKK
jgi:hypothetical protein